jgi:hypothetical protein
MLFPVLGESYAVKDQLKKLGCKWDGRARVWVATTEEMHATAMALVAEVSARRDVSPEDIPSIEQMIEGAIPGGASAMMPVQRAMARVADGLPLAELWKNRDVKKALGGKRPPTKRPRLLVILAGTRGAKSIFAAACAVRNALLCDLSVCSPGDEIRLPCLATGLDQAHYIYSHALSIFRRNPALSESLIGKPLKESFKVAREDGFVIDFETTAMSSKGNNLVGSWLASVVFDEAPRMGSEDETVRSLQVAHDACADRILRGGQELMIGSPHAPYGLVYELWRERFGHPDEDVVVIQAPGPMLNPIHWTDELLEKLKRTNPFTYITSGLGQFADPESSLIPSPAIAACMSKDEQHPIRYAVEPTPGGSGVPVSYVASLAPGERGAGWTLVMLGTTGLDADGQKLYEEAVAKQWFGTADAPLEPRNVLRECATILRGYDLDIVHVKDTFVSGLVDMAEAIGLDIVGVKMELEERIEFCQLMRGAIVEKRIRLTSNRQQYTDLQRVQKKPTVNGTTVQYPSSGDETACDFVPPLGVCLLLAPEPPIIPRHVARDVLDQMFDDMRRSPDPWEAAARG